MLLSSSFHVSRNATFYGIKLWNIPTYLSIEVKKYLAVNVKLNFSGVQSKNSRRKNTEAGQKFLVSIIVCPCYIYVA